MRTGTRTIKHTLIAMKEKNNSLLWMLLAFFTLALQVPAQAQDDLYFDPATDQPVAPAATNSQDDNYSEGNSNVTRRYNGDDDEYRDEDDYAYEYSSRIRRFHRPTRAMDYYDPYYVDLYNYDPFFLPGTTIYTHGYNDFWTWRRWQRWNRWNSFNSYNYGWGCNNYSPWGWNNGYQGHNAWSNPGVFNNYYYDPYWTWNGYNPYYSNGWNNNDYYYNNNNNNNNNGNGSGNYRPQTYTGVRRGGTTVNPGYARISETGNGRLTSSTKGAQTIELTNRPNGRITPGGQEVPANGQVERTTPANGRRPTPQAPNGEATDRNTAPAQRPRRSTETRPRTETTPTPSRRPPTQQTTPREETQRGRQPETRPTRPSQGTEQPRPTRRQESTSEGSGRQRSTEEAQPTRRQTEERSEERPARTESRPATRSETPQTESPAQERSGGNSNSSTPRGRKN